MRQSVQVAQLKARLSEYLRTVRSGGELIVMDRKTPIARIVAVEESAPLVLTVRPPLAGSPPPGQVPMPPALPELPDAVAFLMIDRDSGR